MDGQRIAFVLLLAAGVSVLHAAGTPVTPTGQTATLLNALLTTKPPSIKSQTTSSSLPQIAAIVNAADYSSTIAPGSLVAVYTANAPLPFTITALSIPLPAVLDIATIQINGISFPLLYANPSTPTVNGQINAQLPYEVSPGPATATLSLYMYDPTTQKQNILVGQPFSFTVASAAPGIFVYGSNRSITQNSDYSLNSAENPAAAGSYVIVYLTGGGALDNPVPTGYGAPETTLSRVTGTYSATIGGENAAVAFLGLTPDFVGLLQANLQIPENLPPGDHPVVITINNNASNAPLLTTK